MYKVTTTQGTECEADTLDEAVKYVQAHVNQDEPATITEHVVGGTEHVMTWQAGRWTVEEGR